MAFKRRALTGSGSILRQKAVDAGYRSWFELATADELKKRGVEFEYEKHKIAYVRPAELTYYLPDFLLLGNGIYIETKGEFDAADRKKHLFVQEQHPELDIRFVFTNPNKKIYPGSLTSCSQWCAQHGFKWASKHVPDVWLQEKPRGHLHQGD